MVSAFASISFILLIYDDVSSHQTSVYSISINNDFNRLSINEVCPGVQHLMQYSTMNNSLLQVNVSECENTMASLPTYHGVTYGVCGISTIYCHLNIQVPKDMIARARIQRLSYWCDSGVWKTEFYAVFPKKLYALECGKHSSTEMFVDSPTNHMIVSHYNFPPVKVTFEAAQEHNLVVVRQSAHSGYVTLPDLPKDFLPLWTELKACPICAIMISFQNIQDKWCIDTEITYRQPNTSDENTVGICIRYETQARVFSVSYLQLRIPRISKMVFSFRMFFSFHVETDQPQMLRNGLFNCSVEQWSRFKHHLDCNMKVECEDGQDETEHCPFSSPECQGLVASCNKCYKYIRLNVTLSHTKAEHLCLKMGGNLASVKTRHEQNDFVHMFKHFDFFIVLVGYTSGWTLVPLMYSMFRKWSDKTMIYNMNHFILEEPYIPSKTLTSELILMMTFHWPTELKDLRVKQLVCETKRRQRNVVHVENIEFSDIVSPAFMFSMTQQSLFYCADGHMTHSFLPCDHSSYSGQMTSSHVCILLDTRSKNNTIFHGGKSTVYIIDMFRCDDDETTVPYTLICNIVEDCPDNSDETFCIHPSCNDFLCSGGQCVTYSQHCNGHADCLDDSDEAMCDEDHYNHREPDSKQQLLINLDGTGYFTQQVMKDEESCPDTHYRCAADLTYCLPVYTRCNRFYDCVYGEDEQDCDIIACPGFYLCLASKVCVHGDHLCDGWGQCPHRDDEWMCDMTCPEGCLCQGHSFLCSTPFSADHFPQLLFLEAKGSGMALTDVSTNAYLIYLRLSDCSLIDVPYVKLFNLQLIDLSSNLIKAIDMNVFSDLPNLRIIDLSNNPLVLLTSKSYSVYYPLKEIDLSRTRLEMFNDELFMYIPRLEILNLSFSAITAFRYGSFQHTPRLNQLDIRGNPFKRVHFNIFSNLNFLNLILSSNFRLCCKSIFPKTSNEIKCLAPHPVFSSCTKLLSTDLYRVFFWLVSILASLGNVLWLVASLFTKKIFMDRFVRFLIHYQFTNICKGISTGTITVGNELFYENYIHFEMAWINSVICKVVAFLTVLSTQVSVLIVWLITLDQVTIVCFPLISFSKQTTAATCMVAWVVGIALSSKLLLSELPHWSLDGQSVLCHVALFDCLICNNQQNIDSVVLVVFNFFLCLFFVIGQVIIFRQMPKYQIATDNTQRLLHSSACFINKIAVTSAMCWFTFAGIMALVLPGVIPENVFVAVVVFMLPLHSTLSPLFYLHTTRTQQQQREQEERIIQILKSRLS